LALDLLDYYGSDADSTSWISSQESILAFKRCGQLEMGPGKRKIYHKLSHLVRQFGNP